MAHEEKKIVFGIKGKSIFDEILTIPDQVPFDYMHLALLGHCKWLLAQMQKKSKQFTSFSMNYFIIILFKILLI